MLFSFLFPSTLHLTTAADSITPPSGIVEVLRGLLMSMVSNPIDALLNANYIGILVWAVGLGFALRHGNDTTKNLINDVSHAVTFIVKVVIRFAPLGIRWCSPACAKAAFTRSSPAVPPPTFQ